MINENIRKLRKEKGIAQKELAEQLHVTAQAVSRWENGEVEPSIGTLEEMSRIFGISIDELIGGQNKKPIIEKVVEKEYVVKESAPVLAVCEICNKPIYSGSDLHRENSGRRGRQKIYCRDCYEKKLKIEKEERINKSLKRRKNSFVWGGIITAVIVAILLIVAKANEFTTGETVLSCVIGLLFFPFVSCLFLDNNFIGEMVFTVASWGFVKFPGLIFTLDLDGIAWLLTVKLLFWVLGFVLAALFFLLAVGLGLIVGIFVYPYALKKNIQHPEAVD